ncbi:MAG: ribonuclease P protein component [Alphaproteobacteria bacterium]|nr:ribonuclease P protein component [Alphaproteobacteria bacterium]
MRDTIKKHSDFMMTETDPSARSTFFIVRAKNTAFPGDARVGFTATKHTFKLAVDRNRAKRLMRDWVRFCDGLMVPEFDYVFIARPPILTATRDMGRDAMAKALKHILKKYAPKTPTNLAKIIKHAA